jgi:hypothetical protein
MKRWFILLLLFLSISLQAAQDISIPSVLLTQVEYKALLDKTRLSPLILWRDGIQEDSAQWGFDNAGTAHPAQVNVPPADANGANLSRVFIDGLWALRQFAVLDKDGARSQIGIWSFQNERFGKQAKSLEGVYVARELKFPEVISAGGDLWPWVNLWDWHSTDAGGGNRWHTSPGVMLAQDGSMRVRFEWGGPANAINPASGWSTIPLPVGRWFDMEMHYIWSTEPTTVSLWIDGKLALEQKGVITRAPSHVNVETYFKLYGSSQGRTPWTPTPTICDTRNMRVSGERIWR